MPATPDDDALGAEIERVRRLASAGRNTEVVALCSDLVSEFPGHFEPYFHRALAKQSLGDRIGALTDMTQAINHHDEEPASWFFRGRWRIEAGAYSEGISDLSRAILADQALGSDYYTVSARLSIAVAHFVAMEFRESDSACEGIPADAATYLAGRRWRVADLRRG